MSLSLQKVNYKHNNKRKSKAYIAKKKWWKQFKSLSNEEVVFHFVLIQKKFSTQLDCVLNVDEKPTSYSQNSGLLNTDLEYHNLPLFNFFSVSFLSSNHKSRPSTLYLPNFFSNQYFFF